MRESHPQSMHKGNRSYELRSKRPKFKRFSQHLKQKTCLQLFNSNSPSSQHTTHSPEPSRLFSKKYQGLYLMISRMGVGEPKSSCRVSSLNWQMQNRTRVHFSSKPVSCLYYIASRWIFSRSFCWVQVQQGASLDRLMLKVIISLSYSSSNWSSSGSSFSSLYMQIIITHRAKPEFQVLSWYYTMQLLSKVTHLVRPSLGMSSLPLRRGTPNSLSSSQGITTYGFSTYFEEKDDKDLLEYGSRHFLLKRYRDIIRRWKRPLELKKLRRERKLARLEDKAPLESQMEKLVVHNEAVGIEYPPKQYDQFCIIEIDDFQYKVLEGSVMILDRKPEHKINQVLKFPVLLYASKSYTVIGRPYVEGSSVEMIVESMSASEKIIVFKKKRRKQYKKSYGSKVPLTVCRVIKINHVLSEEVLERAIPLM